MKTIEIPLINRAGKIVALAVVDRVDVDLATVRWHRSSSGYAVRWAVRDGKRAKLFLHVVIAERAGIKTDWRVVDHEDVDPMNCRRSNLRPATHAQNARNSRRYRTNTSGIKGVCWNRRVKKWQANIRVDGRKFGLGQFDTREEAASAYAAAAVRFHGSFGRTS